MKALKSILIAAFCALCACGHADLIKQSSSYTRTYLLTSSSDHISGAPGLSGSTTITISKAGGAFGAEAGAITDLGSGWYKVALSTTDTNTLGALNLHIVATGADPTDTADQVINFDPNASSGSANTLLTVGTGTGQLNPNGSGGLSSITTVTSGTAQAGASATITLASSTGATFAVDDQLKGDYILVASGTGQGQARTITGWNHTTNVATVSRAWAVNPDNTSVYYVIGNPHPALDSSLAVTAASVTGNVGGSVNSVTTAVTVGTNNDKTGYSLVQAFPANFSALAIDGSGRAILQPSEHALFPGDVLNATASSYNSANTVGQKINSAASAGNPWTTDISSGYSGTQAGAILSKFLFDGSGNVKANVSAYATGQDPATLLQSMVVDGTFTLKQANALQLAVATEGTRTFNHTTHTAVATYYRRQSGGTAADLTKPIMVVTTVYDSAEVQPVSKTITFSNLP